MNRGDKLPIMHYLYKPLPPVPETAITDIYLSICRQNYFLRFAFYTCLCAAM